jgi:hypothetical protein
MEHQVPEASLNAPMRSIVRLFYCSFAFTLPGFSGLFNCQSIGPVDNGTLGHWEMRSIARLFYCSFAFTWPGASRAFHFQSIGAFEQWRVERDLRECTNAVHCSIVLLLPFVCPSNQGTEHLG